MVVLTSAELDITYTWTDQGHLFCDCLQKSVHFLEIHTCEQKLYFSCRLNARHRSIQLLFLEIVMLMGQEKPFEGVQFTKHKRCAFPQANVPQMSVLFFRRFPYFSRRFPCISRRFPCISGFCILAEKTANSQKRQGRCHTLPHSNRRRMTSNGIKYDGPCKLQAVFMCTTNAHSLLKAISVNFPQKCTLTFLCLFIFSSVQKFQYLLEGSGTH